MKSSRSNASSSRKRALALGQPRPTTNQILESLLATLALELEGASVLDLFAGTGRVGLGCLSGGAQRVTMVEGHGPLARDLKRKVPPSVECLNLLLPEGLERCVGPYHIVLADPPYDQSCGPSTLERLAQLAGTLLQPAAIVCFEHHHKQVYPDQVGALRRSRVRRFGETQLSYYTHEACDLEQNKMREELPGQKRTAAHSPEE